MSYDFVNANVLRSKLYQRYKDFKRFENLTDERIEELRHNLSFLITEEYETLDNHGKLLLYIKILQHLIYARNTGYTFDDKIFMLIEACDPNLEYFYSYINCGKPAIGTPEYEDYLNKASEKTGFKEEMIRKFEPAYYKNVKLRRNKIQNNAKKLSRTPKK